MHKAIDAARGKHYEMTVPWTTTGMEDVGRRTGARLLPNSMFFEYIEVMATARKEMMDALDEFVPKYPQLIEQARKQLGKRFDIREYPNSESIRSHFDLSFDVQPVPTGTDFKGLPKQQLDALANSPQQQYPQDGGERHAGRVVEAARCGVAHGGSPVVARQGVPLHADRERA
ncbi:MAG: hypothetical protein HC794_00755 [Nitrospiraceae bacterium]|nr:hypothetical protein [Nitrospiraceae bacterium]